MITLTVRSYQGQQDLAAIAALINACEAVDQVDEGTSVTELKQEFQNPNLHPEENVCLWEDDKENLLGFAQLWLPTSPDQMDGWLWFAVHPEHRYQGLETAILQWGEQRLKTLVNRFKKPLNLSVGAALKESDRINFLTDYGMQIKRYFYRMQRSLTEPIPTPEFPPGYQLREMQGKSEISAYVDLYNQSFIDHWNHHPLTVERVKYELSHPDYRQDLDLVLANAQGILTAFCHCHINPKNNARNHRQEGWIVCLGTRRGYRRQGLGTAMLLAGMQRLKAAGMDIALLGVDTQNPTGALNLYESVGFTPIRKSACLMKLVSA